jgi:hypothetical protein
VGASVPLVPTLAAFGIPGGGWTDGIGVTGGGAGPAGTVWVEAVVAALVSVAPAPALAPPGATSP